MGELKTIISANIPVSLAQRLKGKTKGTRSRVISRALKAYLDDKEAFNIEDVSIDKLLLELIFRPEISDMQKEVLRQIYLEVKE
jgi:metal-responsive CopG/Arc/MetJ family transcriptional regulator